MVNIKSRKCHTRCIVLMLFTLFVAQHTLCQADTNSLRVLESIIREEHPTGTIVYTDSLDSGMVLNIRQSLQGRKFVWKTVSPVERHVIKLTRREKRMLDSAVNSLFLHRWPENLFQNSQRIPKDSIWVHIFKQNKAFYEARISDTSKTGRENYTDRRVENANTFQFAPIIYLRNKTVILVYMLRLCGTECGVEALSFYKLFNGRYERWILLSGGAF